MVAGSLAGTVAEDPDRTPARRLRDWHGQPGDDLHAHERPRRHVEHPGGRVLQLDYVPQHFHAGCGGTRPLTGDGSGLLNMAIVGEPLSRSCKAWSPIASHSPCVFPARDFTCSSLLRAGGLQAQQRTRRTALARGIGGFATEPRVPLMFQRKSVTRREMLSGCPGAGGLAWPCIHSMLDGAEKRLRTRRTPYGGSDDQLLTKSRCSYDFFWNGLLRDGASRDRALLNGGDAGGPVLPRRLRLTGCASGNPRIRQGAGSGTGGQTLPFLKTHCPTNMVFYHFVDWIPRADVELRALVDRYVAAVCGV